jgi:hypothetical protein
MRLDKGRLKPMDDVSAKVGWVWSASQLLRVYNPFVKKPTMVISSYRSRCYDSGLALRPRYVPLGKLEED